MLTILDDNLFCHSLVFQALGMKVVNIVPAGMLEAAKTKMISALDWSIQRWNEEGKFADLDAEERNIDVASIIERTIRRRHANEEEEEEEAEEEDDEDDDAEEEDNALVDLGESEVEEDIEDESEEDDEDETMQEAMEEEMDNRMRELMAEAEEEAFNYKTSMAMAKDMSPEAMSPGEAPHGCSPVRGGEGERVVEEECQVEEDVCAQPEQSAHHPVGSFSSGIPSTPGRGFVTFETSGRSEEQTDVQPMEETEGEMQKGNAEDPQLSANPATRSTSRPSARKKVKAFRKGSSSLRPPTVGEQSRSSEAVEHSSLDREDESGQVADVEDELVDAIMSEAAHDEFVSTDLNVSSPVEEVAAAVLEVLGQGRSQRDSTGVAGAEEPTSSEAEVVMRKQVICLDSDDEVPEKCVELDVRVKVRDRVPHRVRGTFADYMTDDSEDEGYGEPGYNRVKLNFVDDPLPVLASRPNTGKESDLKDKVHFAPFVDKYLSEVPENVRLNLAHLYKSYDWHKMFAYLSTPAFCEAVKVKHVLHAASLKKMRKRWSMFDSPKQREGRRQFPGSSAAQGGSVVDSTLEIIDMDLVPESPRREVHVGAAESSSPHVGRFADTQPSSSGMVRAAEREVIPQTSHDDPAPLDQAQGMVYIAR
jgi:hypothetical protein